MANIIISPNMNLPVPIPGVDPGPDYANNEGASFLKIDAHDHSASKGVQIQPNGLNISTDLTFQLNNATNLRSTIFASQSAALALATDIGSIYNVNGNLYWNNNSGTPVQITNGTSIVGTAGSISGLPSGTASASYSGGTFAFQSATSTAANIDARSVILRNSGASSNALTLSAPSLAGGSYGIVLPALPPSVTEFVTIDTAGNMGTANSVSGSQIAALSLTGSQIANATITPAKMVAVNFAATASTTTSTTSTTLVDSGLSVTITVSGQRPVLVMLQASGVNFASVGANTAGNATFLAFLRNGTIVSYSASDNFSPSTATGYAPSIMSYVDFPTAGTYTYKLQWRCTTSGDVNMNNTQLIAVEL